MLQSCTWHMQRLSCIPHAFMHFPCVRRPCHASPPCTHPTLHAPTTHTCTLPSCVQRPMDLRTVKERLVAMQYRTPLDFRDDVRQVRAIHWGDWGEGSMKLVCPRNSQLGRRLGAAGRPAGRLYQPSRAPTHPHPPVDGRRRADLSPSPLCRCGSTALCTTRPTTQSV